MTLDRFIAFAVFALVASVTPGPNNAMLLASGVNFGLRRTVPHMLGVTIGFAAMVLSVGLGLQGVLNTVPIAYEIIRWGGAAYMLYLAWKIATAGEVADRGASKPISFLQAVAFQWINPKAVITAATAMTTYRVTNTAMELATLILILTGVSVLSVTLWAAGGVAVRRFLHDPRHRRIFNITMAILLVLSLYPLLSAL